MESGVTFVRRCFRDVVCPLQTHHVFKMAFITCIVYSWLLLIPHMMAVKRQRSVLNVKRQLEYLESLIHRNTFTLREDLFTLQEQVNASIQAQLNDVDQNYSDMCNTEETGDELRVLQDRIKALARGLGEEKKISGLKRRIEDSEFRSAVDMFNSKFMELENRLTNMETEFQNFKTVINRTITSELEKRTMIPSFCSLGNGFIWESSCYVLNVIMVNWTDAVVECNATGGHLAKLETEAEMRHVLPKLGKNTWIGGHDTVVEDLWQWTGESDEIEFILWEPYQPNDTGDCLEAFDGKLNDERCEELNQFVCEYKI